MNFLRVLSVVVLLGGPVWATEPAPAPPPPPATPDNPRRTPPCDDGTLCTTDHEEEGKCVYRILTCARGRPCDPATGVCGPAPDLGPRPE